jgi:exodeoxyribonuclease VII small subunit
MKRKAAVERAGRREENVPEVRASKGSDCTLRDSRPARSKMAGSTPPSPMPKLPFSTASGGAAAPDADALPASYEAGLQELEQLVSELESGQLPLDRLLGSYQRGAALLAFCRDRLQAVEDQIKVLDAGSLKAWAAE